MITVPRRVVLTGLASFPLAMEFLKSSQMALAAPLEDVEITTQKGFSQSAILATPVTIPASAVLLIHGSAGLIDLYRDWTIQFANEGFLALAVDNIGGTDGLSAWIEWLKQQPQCNGKVGVVGWSSGAEWALNVSTTTPVEATVAYVSLFDTVAEVLSHLKGPVLVHLAEGDTSEEAAEGFEAQMKQAGKS